MEAILYDGEDRIRRRALSQLNLFPAPTFADVRAIWGSPDDDIGSGIDIAVYYLDDRSRVVIPFVRADSPIGNVSHEFPNGMVETLHATRGFMPAN